MRIKIDNKIDNIVGVVDDVASANMSVLQASEDFRWIAR